MNLNLIAFILALICFVISALGVPSRIGLTALGLAFLTIGLAFA